MIILWHRLARRDLASARDYITQENPRAAAEVARRVLEAVARLRENPAIGRPGRVMDTRELIATGIPYLLPYTVSGDEIVILRVLHGAQQWPPSR